MPESEHKRIIEIEGVKVEVDLRTVKSIHAFKVGDPIKLLKKDYSGWKVYCGVMVAIDAFKNLPTIVIAYIPSVLSNDGKIEFAYLNAETKDVEIAPMEEGDVVPQRESVLTFFDRSASKLQRELDEIKTRREYFLRQFGTTFGVGAEEAMTATQE